MLCRVYENDWNNFITTSTFPTLQAKFLSTANRKEDGNSDGINKGYTNLATAHRQKIVEESDQNIQPESIDNEDVLISHKPVDQQKTAIDNNGFWLPFMHDATLRKLCRGGLRCINPLDTGGTADDVWTGVFFIKEVRWKHNRSDYVPWNADNTCWDKKNRSLVKRYENILSKKDDNMKKF